VNASVCASGQAQWLREARGGFDLDTGVHAVATTLMSRHGIIYLHNVRVFDELNVARVSALVSLARDYASSRLQCSAVLAA
jgi:hypothetical protein